MFPEKQVNTLHIGLNISNVHGQGYDGASSMPSAHVGVQARNWEHVPLATYVHPLQWALY